jgi:hypothetical protein
VGAHVLSLVRAHYPLLDSARLEAGYPREVGVERADELRLEEMKHAAAITKDIILCLAPAPSFGGTIQLYVGSNTSATISGFQRSTISSILNHAEGLGPAKKSACWVKPIVIGTYK